MQCPLISRALDSGLSYERLARAINRQAIGPRVSLSSLRRWHKTGTPPGKSAQLQAQIDAIIYRQG